MSDRTAAEQAEYLSLRRARMLPILAVIYLSQQVTFFSALDPAGHESARAVKIGAWLVLSAVLLAALTTKGFWLRPREVRDLIDDENTRANRLDAIRYGFVAAMLVAWSNLRQPPALFLSLSPAFHPAV